MDRETKAKLPSDLFGVTPVEFAIPQRSKLIAALKPACLELKAKIEELGLLTNQKIEEKKSEIEHYKDRVKEYDDITSATIMDENERVEAKERIGGSLGEYVTRHQLSRSDIANLYYGHVNLQKKIAWLWPKVRAFDAIQCLSLQKGNLMLNQNIRYFSGKVNLSVFEDLFYGKTPISKGSFEGTAIDITIDFNGQKVRELSYTYYSHGKFVFYALVSIQERTKGAREVWLAFRTDITTVAEASKEEVSIPVAAVEEFNGWHRVDVNLVTSTELAFRALGYIYLNIVKVRVRGPGKIADLIIR